MLVWWTIFLVSASLLLLLIFRNKYAVLWLGTVGMHIVLAAILLYAVNWAGTHVHFHLPVNLITLGTTALLGVPGLAMLIALKLTLLT